MAVGGLEWWERSKVGREVWVLARAGPEMVVEVCGHHG